MTVESLDLPRPAGRATRRKGRLRGLLALSLPYLAPLAVAVAAALLAWQVRAHQRDQVAAEVAVAAAGVAADLKTEISWHVQAFERMGARWATWESPQTPGLREDAALFREHHPSLRALAWLGPDGAVLWQAAWDRPGEASGLAAAFSGVALEALERSHRSGETVFGPPVGPPGTSRLVPLFVPVADAAGGRTSLVALLDSSGLLAGILADQLVLGYGLDVSVHAVPIYRAGAAAGRSNRWLESHAVELAGAPWVLRVWPGHALLSGKASWLPAGVLGAGLLLAGAFAASGRFAQVARSHAAELERAKRELERSNGELEQFAYAASHDLQEPLRQVAGFMGLLERRYGDRLDADAQEFIAFAVEGAQRMQRLINDLLTYSRAGVRGAEPVPTDPARPLARALVDLQSAVEASRAVVTNDSPMPWVLVDPHQLALVFQNLLSNGIKYAGDTPPRIHVGARRRTGEVEVSVSDRGIGIDPRFFERIFVVFQRLHTREQFPGTGIGLAIVKRIVEQHGGRVWVASSPGQGATFHFTLPAPGEEHP